MKIRAGGFPFNIHNYPDLTADGNVELLSFPNNSNIIWNVLGDVSATSGYMQSAARINIRGSIFARG